MSNFDPGHPITTGDLIDDADGAPLPHELQKGGNIWRAVYESLPRNSRVRRDIADNVMRALAPVLWPLLPSNDEAPILPTLHLTPLS